MYSIFSIDFLFKRLGDTRMYQPSNQNLGIVKFRIFNYIQSRLWNSRNELIRSNYKPANFVFTNFLLQHYVIFVLIFSSEKRRLFGKIRDLFSFSTEKYWWKQIGENKIREFLVWSDEPTTAHGFGNDWYVMTMYVDSLKVNHWMPNLHYRTHKTPKIQKILTNAYQG